MRLKKAILIIFFATIYSLLPLKVLAYDVDFFSANDILFYNPDDTGCGDTAIGSSSSGSSADFMIRAEKVVKNLTSKGLSLAAASGVAGNLKAESGIVPTRIQNTSAATIAPDDYVPIAGVGFGIAQWTSAGRQQNLVNFSRDQGKKITDLDLQLDFLWKEVNASYKPMLEKLNGVKSEIPYNGVDPIIASTIIFHGSTKKIVNDPTIRAVLGGKMAGFEGSADSADKIINTRGGFATEIYNEFKGKIPDGTGVAGIGSDNGSSTSGTNISNCGGNGAVSGDIVSTALNFALDTPIPNNISPYMNQPSDAKPAYVEAIRQYNPGANVADCGIFVGTVMIASGVDANYPKGGTSYQLDYVKSHPEKYNIIENPQRDSLQPGDILIVNNISSGETNHHTMIYTGNSPNPAVDASQDKRVPSVRTESSLDWMLKLNGVIVARVIK